ncbi:hypothetical protein B0H19DRAFT_1243103, partial [Mycena capillaripes]
MVDKLPSTQTVGYRDDGSDEGSIPESEMDVDGNELIKNREIHKAAEMGLDITRITLEKHKVLDNLGLAYLKELRSIVCIACETTLMSSKTDAASCLSHYQTFHRHSPQLSKRKREEFIEKFEVFAQENGPILTTGDDVNNLLKSLSHDMERIPSLAAFEKGWVCDFPGCRKTWDPEAQILTLRDHLTRSHKDENLVFEQTIRRTTVQHLGGNNKKYNFAVNPLLNNTDPQSEWLRWSRILHADPDIEQKMFPGSVIDPEDRAATDNFHSKTHWIHHAQEYSVSDTIGLVALATTGDPLLKLTEISRRWIQLPRETMENINPIHLRKLNHWKRIVKDFQTVGKDSEDKYALLVRKLVLFLIRVACRSPNNPQGPMMRDSWDSVKEINNTIRAVDTPDNNDVVDAMGPVAGDFADEDEDATEDQNGDFAGVMDTTEPEEENNIAIAGSQTADTAKPQYPVFLTEKQSKAALQLYEALQQESTDSELDILFQTCLLSAFTEIDSTPENRLHTPMEAFLFALHLRSDGSVKPAVLVTPSLSMSQYAILLCILKNALTCPDGIESRLNALFRWFDPSQISPFATVRYYQGVGWSVVKNLVGVARVLFVKHGEPEFMFDKIKCSAVKWIDFVHDLWKKAEHILREELLMGLTDEELDLGRLRADLEDDAQELADGYGFAPRDKHTLDHIMKVLFSHPPFVAKFLRGGNLSVDALWSFCNSANTFKELLFAIIHLTSGAPKRITELLLHKLFNTQGRPRNVRLILERFFLIGDHSKTTANTGTDKVTIHLLPPALEPLFVRLCLVVLPLERYFLFLIKTPVQENAHSYLFSSLGQRWGPKRARKLMLSLTKKFFGNSFGVSQIRHISPAIIRHYGLDIAHHLSRGAIVALQQGHTLNVANKLYSNPEISQILSPVHGSWRSLNSVEYSTHSWDLSPLMVPGKLRQSHSEDSQNVMTQSVLENQIFELQHPDQDIFASAVSGPSSQQHLASSGALSYPDRPPEIHRPPLSGLSSHPKLNPSTSLGSWSVSGQQSNPILNPALQTPQTELVRGQLPPQSDRAVTPPLENRLKRSLPNSPSKPVGREGDMQLDTHDIQFRHSSSGVNPSPLSKRHKPESPMATNPSEVQHGDKTSISKCPECNECTGRPPREIYQHLYAKHLRHYPVQPAGQQPMAYIYRRMLDGHYLCCCGEDFARDGDIAAHVADFVETWKIRDAPHFIRRFVETPDWSLKR